MPQAVSKNTIKLSAAASGINNYYLNHDVIVSRLFNDGREVVVQKRIIGYNGSTKIATIDGLWDDNFIPGFYTSDINATKARADTFKVVPTNADSRISTNTAIQAMDYITSNRYGRGLNARTELDLPSWLQSARDCDARSDVTVELSSTTFPNVGDVYKYPSSGNILWQGKVLSTEEAPIAKKGNVKFVKFTDVIGKLTHKWNSWKPYPAGALVYHESSMYTTSSAGAKSNPPPGAGFNAAISSVTLTKVSGNGPTTLTLPAGGVPPNPVRGHKNGTIASGYSLYDADDINYWRYQGWDEHDQRYVTRHQTNLMIDTSLPLFDNMNSLLEHFGGMLRYSAGKYYLEVEQAEEGISNSPNEPRHVDDDFIMGKIRISDDGIRTSYNSLTVAYPDPANKFEARNISFFNSEYLKADRNVPKKGNLSIPGITNYYNARLIADNYLNKSRYGLTVSFNMSPRGALLLAGRVINLEAPRYGWTAKPFRIESLTHNTDCSVDIVAKEYDSSFYAVAAVRREPMTGLAAEVTSTTLDAPSGLQTTNLASGNETTGAVELRWVNAPGVNSRHVVTEVYASVSPKLFITVTDITTSNTFRSDGHGLVNGVTITAKTGTNGLEEGRAYYVVGATANTFQLSLTKNGPILATFTNGTALNISFLTATIIANVPAPQNTFVDTYVRGDVLDRATKYYWVRHKIVQ